MAFSPVSVNYWVDMAGQTLHPFALAFSVSVNYLFVIAGKYLALEKINGTNISADRVLGPARELEIKQGPFC